MIENSDSVQMGIKEPPFPLTPEETRAFIRRFPFWYHNIYLGHGIHTMGVRQYHEGVWASFEKTLPSTLDGLSVLDVGTNAGYFALQAKLRSARRVVGTELEPVYLEQAEIIREIWGLDIDYRLMDAHDLAQLDQVFDLVVFGGTLYHLRNPLQVIAVLGRMCTDAILVETECIPDDPRNCVVVRQGTPPALQAVSKGMMKFVGGSQLNGDPTNFWVPDTDCVVAMLREAGFTRFSRPVIFESCRLLIAASKKSDTILDLDALQW